MKPLLSFVLLLTSLSSFALCKAEMTKGKKSYEEAVALELASRSSLAKAFEVDESGDHYCERLLSASGELEKASQAYFESETAYSKAQGMCLEEGAPQSRLAAAKNSGSARKRLTLMNEMKSLLVEELSQCDNT
jgi:hypothetical protein